MDTALQRRDEVDDEPIRAVQRIQHGPPPVQFDAEQLKVLRTSIAADCNDAEFALFLQVVRRTGLDPFLKQIYPIVSGKGGQYRKLAIVTGVDGFRLTAQRTGQLAGMTEPEWCGPDGEWRDVWLAKEPPAACRIAVFKRGCPQPFRFTVMYREFAKDTPTWKAMPAHMLAVRAETHALRKAFPNEMADLRLAEDEGLVTAEPAPRPAARITEDRPRQRALNSPQAPAETPRNSGQRRAAQAAQAGETGSDFAGAAGAQSAASSSEEKCEYCFAPAGKAHVKTCPTRNGNGAQSAPASGANGEELEMQPTPSGNPPKTERERANKRLFGAYAAAGGNTGDGPTMLRHCALILLECLGERHEWTSRTQMTADQMDICAEWLEARQTLPQEPDSAASGELDYGDGDPFQDE